MSHHAQHRQRRTCVLLVVLTATVSCDQEKRLTGDRPLPRPSAPTSLRTSDLVAGEVTTRFTLNNPYEGSPHAAQEGKRFYQWFNCGGCHGPSGGGGIGPPLADSDWIYGAAPAQVFQSIVQGRPNGMPAFDRLSDDVLWKIVTYVRTLDPQLQTQPSAGEEVAVQDARAKETGAEKEW